MWVRFASSTQEGSPDTSYGNIGSHMGAIFLLMSVAFIIVGGFTDGFVGHPFGDMPDHVWGNHWFATELKSGRWPWLAEDNYLPKGGVLWHIDPIGGLYRYILYFLPLHWVWNFQIWSLVTFWAVLAYLWSFSLSKNNLSSILVGIILMGNVHVRGLIHSGLSEYLGLGWIGLYLWMLRRKYFWFSGISLGILATQSPVYGLIGVLWLWSTQYTQWRQWWKIALSSAVIVAPSAWMMRLAFQSSDAAFSTASAPGWNYHALPVIDWWGSLGGGDFLFPDTRQMNNPGIVQSHFIGWVTIALVFLGLKKSKNWAKSVSGFGILLLGTRISIAGWMPMMGKVFLPLAIFYLPYSPFRQIHHPYHLMAFGLAALIPLLSAGLQRLPKWSWLLVLLVAFVEGQYSPLPLPLKRSDWQEDVAIEGTRLDWPPDFSTANRQYLLQQTRHHQPITAGINLWLSDAILFDAGVQRWLRLLDDPIARSRNRDMPPLKNILTAPRSQKSQLSKLGIEWVVVHKFFLSSTELIQLQIALSKEFGAPVFDSESVLLYSTAQL